jgi:hypothetical protein
MRFKPSTSQIQVYMVAEKADVSNGIDLEVNGQKTKCAFMSRRESNTLKLWKREEVQLSGKCRATFQLWTHKIQQWLCLARAARRWLLCAEHRVQSRVSSCGTGEGFSPSSFGFPRLAVIPPLLNPHLSRPLRCARGSDNAAHYQILRY